MKLEELEEFFAFPHRSFMSSFFMCELKTIAATHC